MIIVGKGILKQDINQIVLDESNSPIHPLFQAESSPLNGNGLIHLCFADEQRMPGRVQRFVWPLSENLFDRMENEHGFQRTRYVRDLRSVVSGSPIANRYLFYSLLQNKDVEISWIAHEEDSVIGPSPYIQILHYSLDIQIEKIAKENIVSLQQMGRLSVTPPGIENPRLAIDAPLEIQYDAIICKQRYLYSYILSVVPSFTTEFHYNFALSNLISTLKQVYPGNNKELFEETLSLFPYLRRIERQHILDHVSSLQSNAKDSMDDIAYPSSRLGIHFLGQKQTKKAQTKLDRFRSETNHNLGFGMPDNKDCIYCPYMNDCVKAKRNKSED